MNAKPVLYFVLFDFHVTQGPLPGLIACLFFTNDFVLAYCHCIVPLIFYIMVLYDFSLLLPVE
jgi:hypothetical protein